MEFCVFTIFADFLMLHEIFRDTSEITGYRARKFQKHHELFLEAKRSHEYNNSANGTNLIVEVTILRQGC